MMHPLAVELPVDIAKTVEQVGREDAVEHLGFLKAQDVRLLLGDQAFDERGARAHRVDVPRSDLDVCSRSPLSLFAPAEKKAPAPGAWSEGRLAFVTQGILQTRVTGGNPGNIQNRSPI